MFGIMDCIIFFHFDHDIQTPSCFCNASLYKTKLIDGCNKRSRRRRMRNQIIHIPSSLYLGLKKYAFLFLKESNI